MKTERIQREIEHGKKIAGDALNIWGWGTLAGQMRAKRRAEFFISHGDITAGKKVLELGCGTGEFTKRVATTGADITAVDVSPDLINIARKTVQNGHIRFQIQNIEKMNFEDESFDIVFGSSILHHLNLSLALIEINRVLREAGKAVFTEPNMLNPQIWAERNVPAIRKQTNTSPDETAFIRWNLKKKFLSCNFKNVSIEPFDFLHPLTPKKIMRSVIRLGNLFERVPLLREIAGSLFICASK